jgi:hypothetical protein
MRFEAPVAFLAVALAAACGGEKVQYQPKASPSGVKADVPSVPDMPNLPVKDGDAFTVWGASYYLRSRVHHNDVAGKDLKIAGYITKTNLAEAPKCAVHKTGKQDPEGCEAAIPAFWLADKKDAPENESIKVLGWASNYAQIYDAVLEYKKRRARKKADAEPLMDGFWGTKIPDPLPVAGAKVIVTGNYSTAFTRATSGTEADPIMGLLTYDSVEYKETPEELGTLPGMKP